jgi:hypothetical protein
VILLDQLEELLLLLGQTNIRHWLLLRRNLEFLSVALAIE